MKKILFTLIGCMVAVLSAYAQEYSDMDWMANAPDKYLPKMTQIIISSASPCNQGGEAFKDFIPRFRKDKAFRNSRIKYNEDTFLGFGSEMETAMRTGMDEIFAQLKASNVKKRCYKAFGTWYNVSADEVCFRSEDEPLCDDNWGGSSMGARFQRIDGKWYLTGFFMAG